MSRLLAFDEGGMTYAGAGVNIAAGDESVEQIKEVVRRTHRPGVLGGVGGFGGLFDVKAAGFADPVLVASADGVGTKIEVARLAGRYDTLGYDLVAMLVDDLVCVGAEPLFLLDIITVGALRPEQITTVVTGVADACRLAGVALLGGETAEHGGVMGVDDLDLAGFAVGAVERGTELGPDRVRPGDVLIGFGSPGIRSNGYSLARRVLLDDPSRGNEPAFPGSTRSVLDELLVPSVIYAPAVVGIRRAIGDRLHAAAHITGGGIVGNVPRALPADVTAVISMESFPTPDVFFAIQERGRVSADEMVRVFNCGLGMVLAVDPEGVEDAMRTARENGIEAYVVGHAIIGDGSVVLT